jgi:hypothetical protein
MNNTSDRVERHVEIVVAKGAVLFGVQHFEERRRGVAAEVRSELVDLVEDEDRILRLRAPDALQDLAGQRPM